MAVVVILVVILVVVLVFRVILVDLVVLVSQELAWEGQHQASQEGVFFVVVLVLVLVGIEGMRVVVLVIVDVLGAGRLRIGGGSLIDPDSLVIRKKE